MNTNPLPRKTLADIIMEKITEKQTEIQSQFSEVDTVRFQDLDERVKSMYQGVAVVLHRYRSGKLPKAFKLVPSLQNWEQILYLTNPEKWSAAAMYAAMLDDSIIYSTEKCSSSSNSLGTACWGP